MWTQSSPHGVLKVRSASVNGGAAATVASISANGVQQHARLAASGSAVAAEVFSAGPAGTPNLSVFAGRPAGPLTSLERSCGASGRFPRSIDVSADSVLYVACNGRSGALHNLANDTDRPVPTSTQGLRLAGRFAAWVEGFTANRGQSIVV
jgi:hypothetical protein